MEIDYLIDDETLISTIAGWIYDEWGKFSPSRTLATAHEKVRQTVGRTAIPLTLVCKVEGKPAGTASIDVADMSTHLELGPWMASVYVVPSMRRRGIGAALCRKIKEELKKQGVERAYLFTPDQEKLYARLGWKPILSEDYRGEPVVVMRLDLDLGLE